MEPDIPQGSIIRNNRKTINAWAMYGGIQSLSRSTYSKMIPQTENNAGYFSFYDVCEKTAMMCGLVLFGTLDNITGSMRNSIIALGFSFAIGLILLFIVHKIKTTTQPVLS